MSEVKEKQEDREGAGWRVSTVCALEEEGRISRSVTDALPPLGGLRRSSLCLLLIHCNDVNETVWPRCAFITDATPLTYPLCGTGRSCEERRQRSGPSESQVGIICQTFWTTLVATGFAVYHAVWLQMTQRDRLVNKQGWKNFESFSVVNTDCQAAEVIGPIAKRNSVLMWEV